MTSRLNFPVAKIALSIAGDEATITDVNKHLITVKGENGDHQKTVYDMTLNYDYKDQNITMYARSEYPQFTNGTVYIYVSKFNSYSGWYIDGFGMIIKNRKTQNAWVGHPHLRIIRNEGNFEDDLFNDRW